MFKWIWQFPQHMLALVLLWVFHYRIKKVEKYETSKFYWLANSRWGISLGDYIILGDYFSRMTVKHEYGHTLQSYMFGPLYLLVIGLPSITQNILSIVSYKIGAGHYADDYYTRYPENWADKLGGVERSYK